MAGFNFEKLRKYVERNCSSLVSEAWTSPHGTKAATIFIGGEESEFVRSLDEALHRSSAKFYCKFRNDNRFHLPYSASRVRHIASWRSGQQKISVQVYDLHNVGRVVEVVEDEKMPFSAVEETCNCGGTAYRLSCRAVYPGEKAIGIFSVDEYYALPRCEYCFSPEINRESFSSEEYIRFYGYSSLRNL